MSRIAKNGAVTGTIWLAVIALACTSPDKSTVRTPDDTDQTDSDVNGGLDSDQDGSPDDQDCKPEDPAIYPEAEEVCDGIDNDCDDDIDEGVVSDGEGCGEPDPPTYDDIVDTLHISVRTATTDNADTDRNTLSVCFSNEWCFTLDNPGWNDFEKDKVDVHVFEGLTMPRSAVERVEIRSSNGSDRWEPECMEVAFDGEPVHCTNLSGLWFGDSTSELESWVDPAGLARSCTTCFDQALSHGPMVGAVDEDGARLWARTHATERVAFRIAPDAASLATAAPVAVRYPQAADDFSTEVVIGGLGASATWVYDVEVNGVRTPPAELKTAPEDGPTSLTMAFGSCSRDTDQPIFQQISDLDPDIFLFIGDNHYANTDNLSTLRQFYRWGLEVPERAELLHHTSILAIWDDHDFVGNNTHGWEPGKDVALRVFDEYWANPMLGTATTKGIFWSHRWGDIDLIGVDDRYWRSLDGNVLGDPQTRWLLDTLEASDATFKLLACGSQWTTDGSSDSWAAYPDAQAAFLQALVERGVEGVVLMSGDIHRSELRLLPGAPGGYDLPELTSSPLANSNSGCNSDSELRSCHDDEDYFILVNIDTTLADPTLRAEIRDQDGNLESDWTITRSQLEL